MSSYLDKNGLIALWSKIKTYVNDVVGGLGKVASEDVVPISKGGTGKTKAADGLSALGGIGIDKLWDNSDKSATFEPQTISLDLSKYHMIVVFFKTATNYSGTIATFALKSYESRLISYTAAGTTVRTRTFVCSSTGVQFYDGYYGSTKNSDACIPTAIYGVRNVNTSI